MYRKNVCLNPSKYLRITKKLISNKLCTHTHTHKFYFKDLRRAQLKYEKEKKYLKKHAK